MVIGRIELCIAVSLTLLGNDVKQDRSFNILYGIHSLDHTLNIMAVDRAVVNEPQVLKDRWFLTVDEEPEEILECDYDAYQSPAEKPSFLRNDSVVAFAEMYPLE